MPPKAGVRSWGELCALHNTNRLDTTGNERKLTECSEKSEKSEKVEMPSDPQSQDQAQGDAVLVARAEIGDSEDMIEDSKGVLVLAPANEELYVDHQTKNLAIGNSGLAGLLDRVCVLEQEIASLEGKFTSNERKIDSLEDRVRGLTTSVEAYTFLRHRFISAFEHDKLGKVTDYDKMFIGEGNLLAQGGDATADAQLYKGAGGRDDYTAFKRLYGFLPQIVQSFTHTETINLLNSHAGVRASNYKRGSEKFYKLFAEFVELFELSDFNPSYLNGDPTPVTKAYWSFVTCYKDEVTRGITVKEEGDGGF